MRWISHIKIGLLLALLLVLSARAFAQQQSPVEQALGSKLLQEIQIGVGCNADAITLRADLARAQAKIKELEAKPVPPKE